MTDKQKERKNDKEKDTEREGDRQCVSLEARTQSHENDHFINFVYIYWRNHFIMGITA